MFTSQVLICSCSHSVLTLFSCSMFCLYTFSVNTDTHNRNPTVRKKNYRGFLFFLLLGLCCGSHTLGLWFAGVSQECVSLNLVGCKDIWGSSLQLYTRVRTGLHGLQIMCKLYSGDNANQRWRAWTMLGH